MRTPIVASGPRAREEPRQRKWKDERNGNSHAVQYRCPRAPGKDGYRHRSRQEQPCYDRLPAENRNSARDQQGSLVARNRNRDRSDRYRDQLEPPTTK